MVTIAVWNYFFLDELKHIYVNLCFFFSAVYVYVYLWQMWKVKAARIVYNKSGIKSKQYLYVSSMPN